MWGGGINGFFRFWSAWGEWQARSESLIEADAVTSLIGVVPAMMLTAQS